jgi:hypothetical protein
MEISELVWPRPRAVVLAQPRPLMITNGRGPKCERAPVRSLEHSITEAASLSDGHIDFICQSFSFPHTHTVFFYLCSMSLNCYTHVGLTRYAQSNLLFFVLHCVDTAPVHYNWSGRE